jgi:DNA recombination-dependent growth factor C
VGIVEKYGGLIKPAHVYRKFKKLFPAESVNDGLKEHVTKLTKKRIADVVNKKKRSLIG